MIRRTPLLDTGDVLLKLEHLQVSGSFKIRGALHTLTMQRPDRVVTASGGNHGIAVATAAAHLGIPATVVVPVTVPAAKAHRIEAAGAKLVRAGDRYADAVLAAQQLDGFYLPAYDHPDVVAGQSGVAREIVEDAPDVDAIVVAVGGGGLVAGTALAAGGRHVVAVEPAGCDALHRALREGRPVDAPTESIAASALGATRIGAVPWQVLSRHEVTSVLVSDEQILDAQRRLWDEFRLAVEPAAAAPYAAWLAGLVPGDRPCLVLCGANQDWAPVSSL